MSKSGRRYTRKFAIAHGPTLWRWHYGPETWHPKVVGTNWRYKGLTDGH